MKAVPLLAFLFIASCSFAQKKALAPEAFQKAVTTQKVQLLDVRTPKEYKKGIIPGAVNIDWEDSLAFRQNILTLDKSQPVYVYCKSGRRSSYAMDWMLANGFTEVIHLAGGVMAWENAGLSLEKPKKPKKK